jgi:glutamine amidotransferase
LLAAGWPQTIRQLVFSERRPILGICLGMQMLAEEGEEGSTSPGLGLLPGRVRRLDALGCKLRIPHVGWNDVTFQDNRALFAHVPQHSDFYFVHSFALDTPRRNDIAAITSYGVEIVAAVSHGNVLGTQFHPEKSSKAGRQVLRNFMEYIPC